MHSTMRGRPRRPDIDQAVLEHALDLLQERGYDGLRMKDVAEAAGVGLGALYRRWGGKQDLIKAALRANVARHEQQPGADPLTELNAALDRIVDAMPRGLGRLIAVCLSHPDSELAQVVREAKLLPMIDGLTARLENVIGPSPDARRHAETALSYLIWTAALAPDDGFTTSVRDHVLVVMGVQT